MKKHEYLTAEDYYEINSVGTKGRMDKTCEYCGGNIPKGQPHDVHKFYGDGGDWPTYPTHKMNPLTGDNVSEGTQTCSELFVESLN